MDQITRPKISKSPSNSEGKWIDSYLGLSERSSIEPSGHRYNLFTQKELLTEARTIDPSDCSTFRSITIRSPSRISGNIESPSAYAKKVKEGFLISSLCRSIRVST